MSIELELLQGWAHAWLGVLLDAAVKGSAVLVVAGLTATALRKASASARQLVWLLALTAVLILPVVSAFLPAWQVLPGWARLGTHVPQEPQPIAAVAERSFEEAGFSESLADGVLVAPQLRSEPRPQIANVPSASQAPSAAAQGPLPAAQREISPWALAVPTALGVWALGTLVCLAPLVLGRLSLWRLARRSRHIDDGSWAVLTHRATRTVGLRRRVQLLQSDAEPMPIVWGVWRPNLLLPAEAENWPTGRRWVVLLHELAHAKRHDCLAKLIAHVACAAHWFNPLCWVAFQRMQTEAEAACDDLVLAAGHRPSDYAQHLLEIASGLKSGMLAAYSSIAMARERKLEGRLLAILDGRRNRRALTRLGMLAAAILLAAIVVPISILKAAAGDEPGGATPTDAPRAGERFLEVTFVDRVTKQPLGNVDAWVRVGDHRYEDQADENGRLRIPLPEEQPYHVSVVGTLPSHVGAKAEWHEVNKLVVPDAYAVEMMAGVPIGGVVNDEQGKPIAGAQIELNLRRHVSGPLYDRVHYETVKTDEQGRWSYSGVPDDPDLLVKRMLLRVEHATHASDKYYRRLTAEEVQKLFNKTYEIILAEATPITGIVRDAERAPVAGAVVRQGEDRHDSGGFKAKTDAEGRFAFPGGKDDVAVLTIQAPGFAPGLEQVNVGPDMAPVEITLKPGRTIRGRVVDTEGRSLAEVRVYADTWRGYRSIDWNAKTDAEGRFEWTEAPADEVMFYFYKEGYMSARDRAVRPSQEEHIITLNPPLRIRGSVFDAETGKPLEKFTMVAGISWDPEDLERRPPHWERRKSKQCVDGKYEAEFTHPYPAHLIRIEAEGYTPGVSRAFTTDEGEQVFNFELKKGTGLTGLVQLPDGKPAAGAKVILATPGHNAYIRNGKQIHDQGCAVSETGPDGRYRFGAQEGKWRMVVLHDGGYAELDQTQYGESPEIKIQPWGRIEGRLLIGRKPEADERIGVSFSRESDRGEPSVYHDIKATTDTDGRFVIDRLPPGEAYVGHQVEISRNRWTSRQSKKVKIEPGQTVHVTLGGKGRPVVGRVVWPPDARQTSLAGSDGSFRTKIERLEIPLPKNWAKMDNDARGKWYEKWRNSEEGRAFEKAQKEAWRNIKHYNLIIRSGGLFRVEDIPAGVYELHVYIRESQDESAPRQGQPIASLTHEFIVPEMPSGRSDEPLDLGTLELTLPVRSTGDVVGTAADASPGKAETLIGKPLPSLEVFNLKDVSQQAVGKRILMCFWEMNQRPSRHCIRTLGKMADELAAKGVVVVSVHASAAEEETLKNWMEKSSIALPMGQVPADAEEKTLMRWCVGARPWLILTDEKHIVRAEGFHTTELPEKLRQIGVEASVPVTTPPKPAARRPETAELSFAKPRPPAKQTPARRITGTAAVPAVWVLHNEDSDFKKPPFEDTLTALTKSGEIVVRTSDLNISQTVGSHRSIASVDSGKSVIVCEGVGRRISKRNLNGEVVFSIPVRAIAVEVAADGSIFALTSDGTIYGNGILRISPKGEILAKGQSNGSDLVADEERRALYLVGADIKYVGFDLKTKWMIDPIGWCAVSVDVCSDGSAWVAERTHPQSASKDRLIHVSSEGKILHTIDLPYSPYCVRVDRTDDRIYTVSDRLYKYDKAGKPLFDAYIGVDGGFSLAIDADRSVWVGTKADVRQFTAEGKFVRRIEEFPNLDQKYVVCPRRISGGATDGS